MTIMELVKKVLIGLFTYVMTCVTITAWAYGDETCTWIVFVAFLVAIYAIINNEEDY